MYNSWDLVELDSGDLVIAQQKKMGLVKINYGAAKRDSTFGNRGFFKGTKNDSNCANKDSRLSTVWHLGIDRVDTDDNDDDLIYAMDKGRKKIVVSNVSGECVDVISLGFKPRSMTIRTFTDDKDTDDTSDDTSETHLFVGGFVKKNKPSHYRFWTTNLTNNTTYALTGTNSGFCDVSGDKGAYATNAWALAVDGAGGTPSNLYATWHGHIVKLPLTTSAWNSYCFGNKTATYIHDGGTASTTSHSYTYQIEMDPVSDDYIYMTGASTNQVSKYKITATGLEEQWKKGTRSRSATESDATVNFWKTNALFVGEGNANTGNGNALVYVGSNKPSVQSFDKDHASGEWQKELGGSMGSRMDGAKKAIKAIVTDNTLTAGANFGYGHWSAGIVGVIGTKAEQRQQGSPDY